MNNSQEESFTSDLINAIRLFMGKNCGDNKMLVNFRIHVEFTVELLFSRSVGIKSKSSNDEGFVSGA